MGDDDDVASTAGLVGKPQSGHLGQVGQLHGGQDTVTGWAAGLTVVVSAAADILGYSTIKKKKAI